PTLYHQVEQCQPEIPYFNFICKHKNPWRSSRLCGLIIIFEPRRRVSVFPQGRCKAREERLRT
ncbi:hypothetical protein CI594_22375, partial [Fischerella thermalis CCMEE 5196]